MEKEYSDSFFALVRNSGTGVLEVTIPFKVAKFEGWKAGDTLKLIAKKVKLK